MSFERQYRLLDDESVEAWMAKRGPYGVGALRVALQQGEFSADESEFVAYYLSRLADRNAQQAVDDLRQWSRRNLMVAVLVVSGASLVAMLLAFVGK